MDVSFVLLSKYIVHFLPMLQVYTCAEKKTTTIAPSVKAAFLWCPFVAPNETHLLVLTCLPTQYSIFIQQSSEKLSKSIDSLDVKSHNPYITLEGVLHSS